MNEGVLRYKRMGATHSQGSRFQHHVGGKKARVRNMGVELDADRKRSCSVPSQSKTTGMGKLARVEIRGVMGRLASRTNGYRLRV